MKAKIPNKYLAKDRFGSLLLYDAKNESSILIEDFMCLQLRKDQEYHKSDWQHNRDKNCQKFVHLNSSNIKVKTKEDELKEVRDKFYELLPILLKEHKGKYAAVGANFVEIHENKYELFKIVLKKYGYKTIYLNEITFENKAVRFHSPRIKGA